METVVVQASERLKGSKRPLCDCCKFFIVDPDFQYDTYCEARKGHNPKTTKRCKLFELMPLPS